MCGAIGGVFDVTCRCVAHDVNMCECPCWVGWIAPGTVRLPQRYLEVTSSCYAQKTMALQQLAALQLLGLDDGPLVLADIEAAYLKAARSAPPDKGGCAERFGHIKEANELLCQRAAVDGPKKDDGVADDDEMVFVLPADEMKKDPYFGARIMMVIGGVRFFGVVEQVRRAPSGEKLYFIRYADGDVEHLEVGQLREAMDAAKRAGKRRKTAHVSSL